MAFNAVKGTHDLYGEEAHAYTYIIDLFKAVAKLYGYQPIETPILEHTDVFDRATGEGSDVVRKEMYTFLDKGNRSVTMRPEGTAGVIRSIVEKKLYATSDLPLKVYYAGPIFRYERPQLGRYRQFIQAGIEAVGVDSPILDAEAIILSMRVLQMLGFEHLKVKVNTLGDSASRANYKKALTDFFATKIDQMCEDCKQRLTLNPMRILDCKVPEDQEIVKDAPKMKDYLSDEASDRFYKTLSLLADAEIDYEIDETLVRGLDYYGHIVFEVHASSDTGRDYGALLGGGHYEGLIKGFGGPENVDYGVGFAMGVERIYSVMKDNEMLKDADPGLDIYFMPLGDKMREECLSFVDAIRALGYSVEMPFTSMKMGAMFKRAERRNAKVALILGEDELAKDIIQLKNLATKEQMEVKLDELDVTLDRIFGEVDDEECECGEHHCCCHDHEEGEEHHCCHDHEDGEEHHCCHHHHDEEK